MATTTENLGLTLPAGTDRAEISVLNENFQTLDTFAGQATDDIQQAQETANAAAPQASTYTKDEVDAAIEEAIASGVVVDTTYDGTSENAQAGTAVAQAISTKVDKVTGKGLSTNDFTNADKTKLEGIESGAEANVQANWAQTDITADDYIKNKPTIPSPVTVDQTYSASSANAQSGVAVAQAISTKVDKETGKGLSTNDFTNTDKANLETALTKANAAAPQSTTYTKTEVDTSQAAQDTRLDWMERNIETIRVMMDAVLYGYRVNKNDSNPETRVEYMYDAVGMTPARMDYQTGLFDYGSWADVWFVTENKPCAVNYNGTVDYYLDPTDYTKKADGTASDLFVLLTEEPSDWATKYTGYFTKDENDDFVFVTGESAPTFAADTYYTNSAYTGNFMAQMPTVWFKRWEDADYEYVAICNKQLNSDFKAYAHDAGDGYINPYTYLPMFKGVTIDGKLRSIAGAAVEGNTSGSQEKSRAEANGAGWQLWDWAKHELVSDLLTLISRTSNSQAAFCQGDTNTYVNDASQNYGKLNTGQHKVGGEWVMYGGGRFWGASDDKHHVKVFHIEDFWGNRWDRCLGLNLVNMEYVYKMVRPYSLDTDSTYTHSGLTAPETGYQKTQYAGRFGAFPKAIGGSQTTYVCDYFWSASGTRLGLFGGDCGNGDACGSRCLRLIFASGNRGWSIGGSPCFNPPHEGV